MLQYHIQPLLFIWIPDFSHIQHHMLCVKVVALMCDLHKLLVGEPKGVLEGGVFSCTKDDLEGNRDEAVKTFRWIAN